jgi:hypothetical protein
MWWLIDVLLFPVSLPTGEARRPKDKRAVDPGRRLGPFRWVIYGGIGLGVLMLVVAGVALLLAG